MEELVNPILPKEFDSVLEDHSHSSRQGWVISQLIVELPHLLDLVLEESFAGSFDDIC